MAAALVLQVSGCKAPVHLDHFTGEKWNGTVTLAGICSDGAKVPSMSDKQAIAFEPIGPNKVEFSNLIGCKFQFDVQGDTARLSNAPVTCTATDSNGATGGLTYDTMTATTTDGHNLKVAIGSYVKAGTKTCNIGGTGTFTR
jgi:hypothetical protein